MKPRKESNRLALDHLLDTKKIAFKMADLFAVRELGDAGINERRRTVTWPYQLSLRLT